MDNETSSNLKNDKFEAKIVMQLILPENFIIESKKQLQEQVIIIFYFKF
jgi:hypothetical protein